MSSKITLGGSYYVIVDGAVRIVCPFKFPSRNQASEHLADLVMALRDASVPLFVACIEETAKITLVDHEYLRVVYPERSSGRHQLRAQLN